MQAVSDLLLNSKKPRKGLIWPGGGGGKGVPLYMYEQTAVKLTILVQAVSNIIRYIYNPVMASG
jgi:hypothetical protein